MKRYNYLRYKIQKREYQVLKRQIGGGNTISKVMPDTFNGGGDMLDNDKVIKMLRETKIGDKKSELERLKRLIKEEYPEYLKNPERKFQMFNEYFFKRDWRELKDLRDKIHLKVKKGKDKKAWRKVFKDTSLKKLAKITNNKDIYDRLIVLKKRYEEEVPDFDMATLGKEAMKVGAEFEESIKKDIMKMVLEREGIKTKGMKIKGDVYKIGKKTYKLYPNLKMYTSCYRSKEWNSEPNDDIRETEIDFVITDENNMLLYIVEAKSNVRNISGGYVQIVRKLRCMNQFDDVYFMLNDKKIDIDLSKIKEIQDMKDLFKHGYVIAKLGDIYIDFNKVAVEAVISQIIFHGMRNRYYRFNTNDHTIESNFPDKDLRKVIDGFIDRKINRHDKETSYSDFISFNEIYIPSLVLSNFKNVIVI
jgi:hypothetical protein